MLIRLFLYTPRQLYDLKFCKKVYDNYVLVIINDPVRLCIYALWWWWVQEWGVAGVLVSYRCSHRACLASRISPPTLAVPVLKTLMAHSLCTLWMKALLRRFHIFWYNWWGYQVTRRANGVPVMVIEMTAYNRTVPTKAALVSQRF